MFHQTLFVLLHKGIGVVTLIRPTHRSCLRGVIRAVTQGDRGCWCIWSDALKCFTIRYFHCYTRESGLLLYFALRIGPIHETLFVLLHKGIGVVGVIGLTYWSGLPHFVRAVKQGNRGCYSNSSYASEQFLRRCSYRYTRGSGLLV